MVAMSGNCFPMMEVLIADDRVNVNYEDGDGQTPLALAIERHILTTLKMLLKRK